MPLLSRSRTRWLLALLFASAGVAHFIIPQLFIRIVPAALPNPALLVAVSGVAEFLGAVGMLIPATRRAAGWGLIALLFAVFPANVNMLWMAMHDDSSVLYLSALWLRLPLQGALIWWVHRAAIARDSSEAGWLSRPA